MNISRIELKGFKSFSDRTVLHLSPGLNVITGPNGSGKSNLIDAIRFVMGENSMRGLRADRLTSLISDNLKGRNQRSYVRMVIDNRNRIVPIEEDDIVITRYIDNKGESKYYLNRRRAPRLAVINALSMAGLSPRGYNIVVQGEIARISEKSQEEVRGMIEEATGISSFDEKKKQAEMELREADVNLKVAMSKLEEVKSRVEELEREMNRAISAVTLRETVDELKRHMLWSDFRRREAALSEAAKEAESLASYVDAVDVERRETSDERKRLVEEILRLNKTIEDQSRVMTGELTRELSDKKVELSRVLWEIPQAQETKKGLILEMREKRELGKRLSAAIWNTRRNLRSLARRVRTIGIRVKKLTAEKEKSGRALGGKKRELDLLRTSLRRSEDLLARTRIEISHIELQVNRTSEQIADLEKEERAVGKTRRLHARRYLKWKVKAERLGGRLEKMTQEAQEFGTSLADSLSKAEKLERGEATIRELMSKMEAAAERIRGNLEISFGLGEPDPQATEAILREAGVSVLGVLRGLVRPKPGFERALDATLGEWLDAIVVGKEENAPAVLLSLLNVGVIPARLVRAGEAREIARGSADGQGLLDQLEFPPELGEFLRRQIGEIAVVPDAVEAAVAANKGLSSVTKDGVLFVGEDTAGAWPARPTGRMSLIEKLTALEVDLSEVRRMREEILGRNITELRQSISEAGSWVARVRNMRNEAMRLLSELREKMEIEARLMKAEGERLRGVGERLSSLRARRREFLVTLESLGRQASQARRETRDLSERSSQLSRLVNQVEGRMSWLDSAIRAASQILETSNRKMVELGKRERELSDERRDARTRTREISKTLVEVAAKLRSLDAARGDLQGEVSRLQSKLDESVASSPTADSQRDRLTEQLRTVDGRLDELDGKAREAQSRHRDAQARTHDIEKEIAALKEKLALLGDPKVPIQDGLDLVRFDSLVKDLESELQGMGPVNMLARDQYAQQAQNYVLVSQRLNTLEDEKRAILDLIAEIERNKKETFLGALRIVNDSFAQYFNGATGGSAWLECDRPDDPFQGGLSVMVEFPGKAPRLVYGSSGGEKSVTALCLIFALQQLKPAPFYFFDEIDAHLDAMNIQNYIKLISMRASNSQLIVISLKDVVASGAERVIGTYVKGGRSRLVEMPIKVDQKVKG